MDPYAVGLRGCRGAVCFDIINHCDTVTMALLIRSRNHREHDRHFSIWAVALSHRLPSVSKATEMST